MIKKILSIFLVISWMSLIFSFSNSNGEKSGSLSEDVTRIIVKVFVKNDKKMEDKLVNKYVFIVRKGAHFFEYFVLGFLLMLCFKIWNVPKSVIISALICIIFAITDEVHQSFVDGRTCSFNDMLLDSSASLISSYLFSRFINLKEKKK